MKSTKIFAVVAALLVGLAFVGCKSKEEQAISSALDDMEKVVVKFETLVGKVAGGEVDPGSYAATALELNEELNGIMGKPEYAEYQAVLSNVASWPADLQKRQQELTARMVNASAQGTAALSGGDE